jgi:Zn-dependent protease
MATSRPPRRWSWRIGRIAGIDVYVHATFPLLFLWIALSELGRASGRAVVATLLLTVAVFVIVVLHECGHALVARRYGIRTRDITLLPIGGIARLERMPREPRQELLVALAGPAVNVVLAVLLYGVLAARGVTSAASLLAQSAGAPSLTNALAQLLGINVWLAAFNLIPAFPMDGGRVLRALVVRRSHDYVKATMIAARTGRALALVFAILGIFWLGSPMLALIALFVWIAATSEALTVRTAAALEHVPISGVMVTDFRTLSPNDTLARAAELTIDGFQHDFPVVENGTLVGMLTHRALLIGLSHRSRDAKVGDAMEREYLTASADAPAEAALERLADARGAAIPVLSGRQLVGLLTADNVSELVSLRTATGGQATAR